MGTEAEELIRKDENGVYEKLKKLHYHTTISIAYITVPLGIDCCFAVLLPLLVASAKISS